MASEVDKELASYRDLMRPPGDFEDGFNLKTVIGILFVAAVMMPSTIYLQLTVGQTLGSAAVWVTVIQVSYHRMPLTVTVLLSLASIPIE